MSLLIVAVDFYFKLTIRSHNSVFKKNNKRLYLNGSIL